MLTWFPDKSLCLANSPHDTQHELTLTASVGHPLPLQPRLGDPPHAEFPDQKGPHAPFHTRPSRPPVSPCASPQFPVTVGAPEVPILMPKNTSLPA